MISIPGTTVDMEMRISDYPVMFNRHDSRLFQQGINEFSQ